MGKILPEKGREILDEKYWDEWDRAVDIRVNDLYNGADLKECLEVVEAMNNGCSLEDVKAILDGQNHSGMSYGLVVREVASFCDRGIELLHYLYPEIAAKDRAKALIAAKDKENAWRDGTKEEIRNGLCALGKSVLDAKYLNQWNKLVDHKVKHAIHEGYDLQIAAYMIEILNNGGSVVDAKAIVDVQSWGMIDMSDSIYAHVNKFCDRGQELMDYVHSGVVYDEHSEDIDGHEEIEDELVLE